MEPPGAPKETQNRLKSQKMPPKTLPKTVWRPSLEKVASQTLPETPLCAENITPAMLFTLPTGYPQPPFRLHFGSILGAFWAPLAPKSRPRREKEAFKKQQQKKTSKKVPKSLQNELQKVQFKIKRGHFFASLEPSSPQMGPRPHFGSILHRKIIVCMSFSSDFG